VVDALNWTGKRVRINIFGGMPPGSSEAVFDLNQIHYNEITITGTSDSTPRQLQLAAALIASGRIDTSYMISRVVGLAEAREIIVNGPEAEWIKIAVDPAGKE
jgi:L-iditol 2-dehydrogenase